MSINERLKKLSDEFEKRMSEEIPELKNMVIVLVAEEGQGTFVDINKGSNTNNAVIGCLGVIINTLQEMERGGQSENFSSIN